MGELFRLLIIFAALWLVVQVVRRALHPDRSRVPHTAEPNPQRMLPCAYCGVHVPESEAIKRADKIYCSNEHRKLEEAKS